MGDAPWVLLGLALAFAALSTPVVAWRAFLRGRDSDACVRRLEERLEFLEQQLAGVVPAAPTSVAAAAVAAEPVPVFTAPEELVEPSPEVPPAPPTAVPLAPAGAGTFETRLAQRWFVWLGALALGLGGLFAAGWAVEQGLVGPRVRVLGAALLGFALVALAERARRGAPAGTTDFVAPALAAGGLCALYGAALAAYLAYDLLAPGLAFALLALTSGFGLALGLRHGPLVALLGTVGAYASPLFVATDQPSAWALFVYLGVVALGAAALARLVGRAWVAWTSLAGGVAWQLLWLATEGGEPAGAPGLHLLVLGGTGLAALLAPATRFPWPTGRRPGLRLAFRATAAAAALLHQPLLVATGHAAGAVLTLTLLAAAMLAAAWIRERERWLAAAAAAACLTGAASWSIPALLEPTSALRDPSIGLDPAFWIAPEAAPLVRALAGIAAVFGAVGFLVAWRPGRRGPGFWAGLSAAVPLAALAVAHARLEGLAVSPGYAAIALALAAANLLAAERMARRGPKLVPALGAYTIGVVAALALGCALALEDAWLTVALAVLLPAMAWVGRRLDLPAVRRPAWVVAGIVLARLALDVDPLAAGAGGFGQLLRQAYAYGVPAVCLWLASRWFRGGRPGADPLAELLAGGAILAWLLLAAQAARELTAAAGGSVRRFGLAETGLDALGLLGTAYALLRWHRAQPSSLVARFGWRLLTVLGGLVVARMVVGTNPVLTGEPVGSAPVLNALLLAYLGPALVGLLIAREADGAGEGAWARVAGIAGQAVGFVWLTLEVRHWFQGPVLTGPTGEAEWLAYSAAWLAWAALLLVLGVRLDRRPLRVAALAIAALAVAKTFLFDLAGLGGLYRAGSFLALGLCLVGIGWLYRRLVARTPPVALSAAPATS